MTGPRLSQLTLYRNWLEQEHNLRFADYDALWRWSVHDLNAFWRSIWDYHRIESPTPFAAPLGREAMPDAVWFEGAKINYAQQVFRHTAAAHAAGQPAIVAENEAGEVSIIAWPELQKRVASLALYLRERGVVQGDRVAAYLPNIPETIVAFLASASLGAIWSVCSPDTGVAAVLDRFRQIRPKVLIATDGVRYAGRALERSQAFGELKAGLPSVTTTIVVRSGYANAPVAADQDFTAATARRDSAVAAFRPEWLAFDHPLWILYSSGTTGLPKAIVHGHGGIVLAALAGGKHLDIGPSYDPNSSGERFHWYSSTGWVMWNAQVGGLLGGTTICCFDGSPSGTRSAPDLGVLWSFAVRHDVTWFGAGAAFYGECRKAGLELSSHGDLSRIRALGSTGSPLSIDVQAWGTEQFSTIGTPDIWWCNISGGTDICTSFGAGLRDLPPTPGRLQCRHLGVHVEAWSEDGTAMVGNVGELVCTRPLPSMPLYFWGDADGARYRSSYFEKWPGIWRHGDWLRIDEDGGCAILGRSDATINRHGLRLGTAELYAAVECVASVANTLVIDLEIGVGESELIMFVVPAEGRNLDEVLRSAMVASIRSALSPRFVPDHLVAAPGIPTTRSGKKQELPVKRLFEGHAAGSVFDTNAMANPEVLPWYEEQAAIWRAARASVMTHEQESRIV